MTAFRENSDALRQNGAVLCLEGGSLRSRDECFIQMVLVDQQDLQGSAVDSIPASRDAGSHGHSSWFCKNLKGVQPAQCRLSAMIPWRVTERHSTEAAPAGGQRVGVQETMFTIGT